MEVRLRWWIDIYVYWWIQDAQEVIARPGSVYNEGAPVAVFCRPPADTFGSSVCLSKPSGHTSSSSSSGEDSSSQPEKNDALSHGGERTAQFSRLPDIF